MLMTDEFKTLLCTTNNNFEYFIGIPARMKYIKF